MALLEMKNITKVYDNGVTANENIDFSVEKGEIHALMGENGAGKSTLMKVLFGFEAMDSGEIFFKGKKVDIRRPHDAIALGIGMVSQHFRLVDSLTVYENVLLGMEPRKGLFMDKKAAVELVERFSRKFDLRVDPSAPLADLSVSVKQRVEILKVLVRGSELIILDEPTALLTPQETAELFQQFKLLRAEGFTIIFISHKINEVKEISDRMTILRAGRTMATIDADAVTAEEISRLMVGRDVVLDIAKQPADYGEELLTVEHVDLYTEDGVKLLHDISFRLRAGQIIGIAGVDGNGQDELAGSIFGLRPVASGSIRLKGRDITNRPVHEIREAGVGLIPADRLETGVADSLTLWENFIPNKVDDPALRKGGLLDLSLIRKQSEQLADAYHIKYTSVDQLVELLSGGNIQKVVVARELSEKPVVLIANQPTRGIDVGAQEFIWNEILTYRDQGNAVLLISADLNEILELSDSVLVMTGGEVAAWFKDSTDLTEDELGLYMLGVKKQTGVVEG